MSDGPWIKFYPSDWLTGTRGMSAAEIGVYITMIAMMYEKSGALVADKAKLARACGIPSASFNKILDRLIDDGKVELDGAILTNDRVRKELHERETASGRASERAKARWEKDKENQGSADATALLQTSSRGARQISEVREEKITDRSSSLDSSVGSPSKTKSTKSKGTRLTEDWRLPKPWGEYALERGLPRERVLIEAEKMKNWSINAGAKGVKPDWFAAWRNWVQKAIDELPNVRGSPRQKPLTGLAAITENFKRELENDGYQSEEGRDSDLDARLPLLAGPGFSRHD
jgi:uncharacterized protein YdaU (DUF1376 family)